MIVRRQFIHGKPLFLVLLTGFLVGLGACRVGHNFHRPPDQPADLSWKVPLDDTTYFHQDSLFATNIVSPRDTFKLDEKWWRIFSDDTLSMLVEKTLAQNPTLKRAAYRIVESRALIAVARSNYYPTITVDPNINRNQLSGNRPNQFTANRLTQVTLTTISFPVDLSYEIDVWGKFRRGVEAAIADTRATEADEQVIALSLAAELATDYFMLRMTDSQIEIFTNALKLREENLKITQSSYQAGITSKLDVSQAEIELGTVLAQLVDTKRIRATTENAIAVLCGVPAFKFHIVPRAGLPVTALVPKELPSDLLAHRPDVAEAEQQMISYNAQAGAAEAALFPSVRISAASAGFLSSRFDNLFDQNSQTWIGGIGISIPVFAGGRIRSQKDAAVARVREAESNYQQVVINAFREVQDALSTVDYQNEQADAQQKVLSAAQSASAMARELYTRGLTTYVNVILADRNVIDAQNAKIMIAGQQLFNEIGLIKALGGGWRNNLK